MNSFNLEKLAMVDKDDDCFTTFHGLRKSRQSPNELRREERETEGREGRGGESGVGDRKQ